MALATVVYFSLTLSGTQLLMNIVHVNIFTSPLTDILDH